MNIHEYQAKELLAAYGVPVPAGKLALTPEEAYEAAKGFGGKAVVKAQAHCGGRGKAGGVKLARTAEEAKELAKKMIGMKLITPQTGADGKTVRKLYVTEMIGIKKEYYLSLLTDSANACLSFIASSEGGTEIEKVSAEHPEKIAREQVSAEVGVKGYTARLLAKKIGLPEENLREFTQILQKLYRCYLENDCTLIEINPLVLTDKEGLSALDAKITFDDNALPRRPEIAALRDELEEDPKEIEAEKYGLNYIALDGSIGCMVNGAGLAMATMDIIKHFGASPANFLDVGGSANEEKITAAFGILLSDRHVKAILVNVFGGIMKCDIIAAGIVAAAKKTAIGVPVVVRLEGTNVEKGKEILRESGLSLISADDLGDAARKCVALVKAGEEA